MAMALALVMSMVMAIVMAMALALVMSMVMAIVMAMANLFTYERNIMDWLEKEKEKENEYYQKLD
jgi:Na+(H+)/acetate symporter ActP